MGCLFSKYSDLYTDSNTDTNLNTNFNTNTNINNDQIKKFNLLGIKGNFYVKSVYDGDTIIILVPMNIKVFSNISKDLVDSNKPISNSENLIYNYEIRLRLFGIDTPELKPLKNIPDRDTHIKKANESKNFLSNLIENKIVTIEFKENDKYGRPLGIIYLTNSNTNINNLMIEKGYAKIYSGGKKDINF
jgi:endonuclease YncB( thermonuclease family)